jgi:hypothetical protein
VNLCDLIWKYQYGGVGGYARIRIRGFWCIMFVDLWMVLWGRSDLYG